MARTKGASMPGHSITAVARSLRRCIHRGGCVHSLWLRRALVTIATATMAILVGMLGTPVAAVASDGKIYDCYSSDYGCMAGTGYSGQAGWGYPGPHNCTLYAAFRLAQNGYPNPNGLGNANEWDERARARGAPVDGNPAVGSIAQRDVGSGHVMYVESVQPDHIVITEDNWGGGTGRARIYRGTTQWNSLEFLHFRDLGGDPIGAVDRVVGQVGGFVSVQGWVIDPDAPTTPTSVHVYIDWPGWDRRPRSRDRSRRESAGCGRCSSRRR